MVLRRIFSSAYTVRTALVVSVVLPTVTLFVVLGGYALHAIEQRGDARMREDIELIARTIAQPVATALAQGSEQNLNETLESVFEFGRVYSAYVYDQDGKLVATGGTTKASVAGSRALRMVERDNQQEDFEEVDGEEIYSYFVPLSRPGAQLGGLLQVTRRGTDFRNYLEGVRARGMLALGAASAALIAVLVVGYYRAFGRHLQRIDQSMNRIREGDHGHRIDQQGPRELRVLAHGINTMLDALVRSAHELEHRRQRENALNERLRRSEKLAALGQVAAGVAHELGTPLAVIDGKAQRALRASGGAGEHDDAFRAIRAEVARMGETVQQLLESGPANVNRERTERLDEIAWAVCGQVADEATAAGVRIETTGTEPAPRMRVDRHRLEQALVNLVRNGVQAAPCGGLVRIEWFQNDDGFGYRVDDTGPGVDETIRARLFEPFVTTKPVGQGTGLGLSVAHAAVAAHEGAIDVTESPLGGARFQIQFPTERSPQ